MAFSGDVNTSSQAQIVTTGVGLSTQLMQILSADSIQPGTDIGYSLAKLIYVYHPLGAKIADAPMSYLARPDLGDAIRICVHGNYLVVFEPFSDGALILRILHGARHLPGILGSQ